MILAKQLIRSGTSIGANMEEADGASSKNDFINKVTIARKEARETVYWLQLIKKAELVHHKDNLLQLDDLINEAGEIKLELAQSYCPCSISYKTHKILQLCYDFKCVLVCPVCEKVVALFQQVSAEHLNFKGGIYIF